METTTVSKAATDVNRWREKLSELPPSRTEAEAIERIAVLEELVSICTAVQAREALSFDMLRRNREAEEGVSSDKQGRGVSAEIALARKVSRARGSKLLCFARTLIMDLPHTYTALKAGNISEEKAQVVAKETSWLPREVRAKVDERMSHRLGAIGVGRLANETRAVAQQLDQVAAVAHLDRSIKERRVSVRPAPGNMAYLTALLPLRQAVAVYANLSKSAATTVGTGGAEERSQSQIMADLLVERVTGQESAEAIPTEVMVVMNEDSLFQDGDEPAWMPGFGPIPAGSARNMVAANEATVFLRRLFTRPSDGQLMVMDSKRREFTGLLRQMVIVRDDVCRTPFCDAQIKHIDHADPVSRGGATTWANASGLCAACNLVKEQAGWRHQASAEKLTVITPTGHKYSVETLPLRRQASQQRQLEPPGKESSGTNPAGLEPLLLSEPGLNDVRLSGVRLRRKRELRKHRRRRDEATSRLLAARLTSLRAAPMTSLQAEPSRQ